MSSLRLLSLGAMLVSGLAVAAGNPMAIVASTAPGLSPGDLVIEGQSITVPSGAIVQLFTVTGREINVAGPFSGVPGGEGAPPPEDKLQVLAAALFGRTDIAVSEREPEPAPGPEASVPETSAHSAPNPVASVSAAPSDTWCLAKDVKTVLVNGVEGSGKAMLVSLDDGQSAPLGWTEGANVTDWPSALPPKDGGRYAVKMNGKEEAAFSVRLMPDAVNGAGRLAQMAAAGCTEQVQTAIRSLSETP
jgi:hypothetical protein